MSYRYRIYFEAIFRTAKAVREPSYSEFIRSCILTLRRLEKLQKKKIDLKPLWVENKLATRLAKVNVYMIFFRRHRQERLKEKRFKRIYTNVFSLFPLLLSLLPEKARAELFEPAFYDLLGDFISLRQDAKSDVARHRLIRGFLLRGILIIGDCYRVVMVDAVRRRLRGGLKSLLGM